MGMTGHLWKTDGSDEEDVHLTIDSRLGEDHAGDGCKGDRLRYRSIMARERCVHAWFSKPARRRGPQLAGKRRGEFFSRNRRSADGSRRAGRRQPSNDAPDTTPYGWAARTNAVFAPHRDNGDPTGLHQNADGWES